MTQEEVYKRLREIDTSKFNSSSEVEAYMDGYIDCSKWAVSTMIEKACELVTKSFKYRQMFNDEHPEHQVNVWDASYYQLKPIWKEYFKEEFEEFKVLYKKLSEKMLPMVYELGFLRK